MTKIDKWKHINSAYKTGQLQCVYQVNTYIRGGDRRLLGSPTMSFITLPTLVAVPHLSFVPLPH